MPILLEEDMQRKLPKMHTIKQKFDKSKLDNIEEAIKLEFKRSFIKEKNIEGKKVAVAVGSRGIKNLQTIVKTTIDQIKAFGGRPFIISAMGSHGRGTESGQREVLEGYGITEESLNVPIITKVDVVKLGKTKRGLDIYFDKTAYEADLVVPINRVKLHTDFSGPLQSGLCKMLVIGLGNHVGCSSVHEQDPNLFAEIIEEAASIIIDKTNVGFGLAIIENAYDETAKVQLIPSETMIEDEKELVKMAKNNMPYLRIPEADVLVVEEIGKDVSGAGFDPNILGRSPLLKTFLLPIPRIQKMVLLDVTEASHGNGIGVGFFDVITKNVFDKLDLEAMYTNAIACKCIDDVKIPLITEDENEAIRVALKTCRDIDRDNPKIIKIKNTLELEYIQVSEALMEYVDRDDMLSVFSA